MNKVSVHPEQSRRSRERLAKPSLWEKGKCQSIFEMASNEMCRLQSTRTTGHLQGEREYVVVRQRQRWDTLIFKPDNFFKQLRLFGYDIRHLRSRWKRANFFVKLKN
jgi:hypothetical protein